MATRMQQRRGTAAQWTSSNSGDGPILNAGEIGWESDTNKFKIGDGVSSWTSLTYFVDATDVIASSLGAYLQDSDVGAASGVVGLDASKNAIVTGSSIIIEGATDNAYETTLTVTDPTADRTITFPNATGTVVLSDGSGNITVSGDLTVSGTTTTINSTTINATTGIIFEGATADAFETTLTVTDPTADRTVTFQDATGTVVLRDSTDTLTNKSISLGSNTVTSTLAQLNTAVSDADVASLAGSETLTNKTVALGSNTVSGTIAQFNTAVTDADFATLAGTETLTNKTLTSPAINTPTGITKTDVGLANVDNTTDANKPVSTATQTALDLKAPLASPTFTGTVTLPSGTVTSTMILDGTIATADIADSAITSAKIANDTIVDADINSAAAIAQSKISGLTTDLDLKAPLASPTFTGTVVLPSSVNGPSVSTSVNLLSTSTSANITLGAQQTAGNLTIGGGSQRTTGIVGIGTGVTTTGTKTINVGTGSTGGTTAITIGSADGATSNVTLNGTVTAANNLVVTGDLTVNGTTTTINSTTLAVDDKNVVLGDIASPTDVTADGGGITLKGATDKTFNWVDATDAWTSSEHINLVSGKAYEIAGTSVLSGSTLGSGVTGSSLTSVGTITSGTWTGTAIAIANGGTGATTAMTAATALLPSQTSNSGKYLTTDGSGTLSWGTVSGYSAPTLGNVSIASGSTTTTITGLTKLRSAAFTSLDANSYEQDIQLMQLMGAL
jgi:hypothetical protein